MVKIEIDIPEWAIGKHIDIFAGSELLATLQSRVTRKGHKQYYLPLIIKSEEGRCNGCGKCCDDGFSVLILKKIQDAMTKHLEKYGSFGKEDPCPFVNEQGCILGAFIPFSCARSICTGYEGCSEYLLEANK